MIPLKKKDERGRAKRLEASDLIVDSKTIGSNLRYTLESKDFSKTGLYLSWNSNVQVPYLENTILELQVDTARKYFEAPLDCLGKVTRRVEDPEGNSTDFGIKIVQIGNENLARWEQKIFDLEENSRQQEVELPVPLFKKVG